jgi:hypothetical protein
LWLALSTKGSVFASPDLLNPCPSCASVMRPTQAGIGWTRLVSLTQRLPAAQAPLYLYLQTYRNEKQGSKTPPQFRRKLVCRLERPWSHVVKSREPQVGCQLSWFMTSIESRDAHRCGEQWQHKGHEDFR